MNSDSSNDIVTISLDTKMNSEYPKLISFPQGVPENSKKMNIEVQQLKEGKKRKTTLTGQLNGAKFQATDFGVDSWRKNSCKFAIGILKDNSSTMKLIPVDHAYVMKLMLNEEDSQDQSAVMTYDERRQSLTDAFGSRKRRKALRAAQSNIISTENITGASELENAMMSPGNDVDDNEDGIKVDAAQEAMLVYRSKILPEYNIYALSPEDIYSFSTLQPNSLSVSLSSQVLEYVENKKERAFLDYSQKWEELLTEKKAPLVVTSCVNNVLEFPDPNKYLNFLLLFHYCIQFYLKLANAHLVSAPLDEIKTALIDIKPPVINFLSNTFASVRTRKKEKLVSSSKAMLDKLLLHIIAMYLHMSHFKCNLSLLAKGLKLSTERLVSLAKELGCVINKKSTKSIAEEIELNDSKSPVASSINTTTHIIIAELKAPLKLPEIKRIKRGAK